MKFDELSVEELETRQAEIAGMETEGVETEEIEKRAGELEAILGKCDFSVSGIHRLWTFFSFISSLCT